MSSGRALVNGAEDIAVVGLACLFPGAPDVTAFWRNIVAKASAITDPPAEAWSPALYYDPASEENDRVYCKKGGYLGPLAVFDPLEHGIMPRAVEGGEPDQWLALHVARAALANAGYAKGFPNRERAALILGKGTYANRGTISVVHHGVVVDYTLQLLRTIHPELTDEDLQLVRQDLKRQLPRFDAETAPALIPNVSVGRIANRLDLMGPSYTIDAACASSLVAIDIAVKGLRTGEYDCALVGGMQVATPVPVLSLFCRLKALSVSQCIRPFDSGADGTILSEGVGMAVLKRRSDAERDGDRVYAHVKGTGVASDGKAVSVLAPRVDGEELAVRRAYEGAGVDPRSVGLIEAHGTATLVGDAVEIEALTRVFGERDGPQRCALGSVKSMIGHTMPAAGMAGFIKAALSLYHKVLPPTINVTEPSARLKLERTRFYINTEPRPWVHGAEHPRRAGVNAFGFGGINAHVVLEEAPAISSDSRLSWESEVCVLAGASRAEVIALGQQVSALLADDPSVPLVDIACTLNTRAHAAREHAGVCLGVVASSTEDLVKKLERAGRRLSDPTCQRIKDVSGLYFFDEPLARTGKIAFVFPGEGAQYVNMLTDLCWHFPDVRACFDEMDRAFAHDPRGWVLSDSVYPPPSFSDADRAAAERRLWRMDAAVEAVYTANHALHSLLTGLGIKPDALLGHSTGEYSAMRVAGMFSEHGYDTRLRDLNRAYEGAAVVGQVPAAARLIAVGAARHRVQDICAPCGGDVWIAMDNCPHQVVLVALGDAADRVEVALRAQGLLYEVLAFDRPYHTPAFADYTAQLRHFLRDAIAHPPNMPLYSATSTRVFPAEVEAVRSLAYEHWIRPVEFRQTIEHMHADGVRIFVEVGPRGNLSAFIEDILTGRPCAAIPANVSRRSGLAQLNHLLSQLAAHGVAMNLTSLYSRRGARPVDLTGARRVTSPKRSLGPMKIPTGAPEMRLSPDVAARIRTRVAATAQFDGRPAGVSASRAVVPGGSATPPPAAPDGTQGTTWAERAPAPSETRAPVVSAPAPPAGATSVDNGVSAADVMSAYMHTMEQFLTVQQEMLGVSLAARGAGAANTEGGDAPRHPPRGPGATTTGVPVARTARDGVAEPIGPDVNEEPRDTERYSASRLPGDLHHGQPGHGSVVGVQQEAGGAAASPRARSGEPGPLIHEVVSHRAGEALVAHSTIDFDTCPSLRDHALGRHLSVGHPELAGFAIVPFTLVMEIMAEAAVMLEPARTLVGMREVRVHRWLALDRGPVALETRAERREGDRVRVQIFERGATALPVCEGLMVLAEDYVPAPLGQPLDVTDAQRYKWPPDSLYEQAMFHGASFRGVHSVDRVGPRAAEATLVVLDRRDLVAPGQGEGLVTDFVLLDQPGQVIGFWAAQFLDRAFLVLPFRMESLELYGPPLAAGERLACLARLDVVTDQELRSTLEVVRSDGHVWARFEGWADRRFDLPAPVFRLLLQPAEATLSRPWQVPVDDERSGRYSAFRIGIDTFSKGWLIAHGGLWARVLATAVLSERERVLWHGLVVPERRRLEWLLGRLATKDAVRAHVRRHYGLMLCPADVELLPDQHGRPIVEGAWIAGLGRAPRVSLAHVDGVAVGIAGDDEGLEGIGVDLERMGRMKHSTWQAAFNGQERALLDSFDLDERDGWALRLWCAKEAAAKAIGRGFVEGWHAFAIHAVDTERGTVQMRVQESGRPGLDLTAMTAQEDDWIVATCTIASQETVRR